MILAVFDPETGRCTSISESNQLSDQYQNLAWSLWCPARVLDGSEFAACKNPLGMPNISALKDLPIPVPIHLLDI